MGEVVVTEGTDRLMPGVTKVSIKTGKKGKGKNASKSDNAKDSTADASAAQSDDSAPDQSVDRERRLLRTATGRDLRHRLPTRPPAPQTGSGRTRHQKQNGTKTEQ